jgi:hypothetical protein
MENINTQLHLDRLVELAKQDLSTAHINQHNYTADLSAKIGQISTVGPGGFSSQKKIDTVKIDNNKLTGKKFWVSDIFNISWAVLHLDDLAVYVDLDTSVDHKIVPTMGMEKTFTANLTFDQTPCQIICNINDPMYFITRRTMTLGFIAVHYGLACALFEDIDRYTESQKISCQYPKQKLKLQLDVMQLLWDQIPKQVSLKHQSHNHWNQKNTAYAFAKKCLTEICQFVTEITGSGLYDLGNKSHQRYKDALIYSTHMKNLFYSTIK